MQLTSDQVDALKAGVVEGFARRLARYFAGVPGFRTAYDGEPVPTGTALEARLLELIVHARAFGIATELGVGQFVLLDLGYARDFHRSSRVASMLADPSHSPDRNIQRILNAVIVAEARVT